MHRTAERQAWKPELGTGFLPDRSESVEYLALNTALWVRMEPPPISPAVEHHVVGFGEAVFRIGNEFVFVAVFRAGERDDGRQPSVLLPRRTRTSGSR